MKTIKEFYDKHLKGLEINAADYVKIELNAAAESYFEKPKNEKHLYYSFIDLENNMEGELQELWKDKPQLLPMIGDFVQLAIALKEERIAQSEELSEFVYVMF